MVDIVRDNAIIWQYAKNTEEYDLIKFNMDWVPYKSITDEEAVQFPILGIVRKVKLQQFRERLATKMHNAERAVKAKHISANECIQIKTHCFERAHTLGVCL